MSQEFEHEISKEDFDYLTAPRVQPQPCAWCGGRLSHADLCVSQTPEFLPKVNFGKKHRGKPVRDTPADYLIWALDNIKHMTIEANHAAIEKVRSEKAATTKDIERWERRLSEREQELSDEKA